ncbi:hypothetical protein BDN71DRAFT_1393210 [Pleurotus eryngii]|uniref:Uncharacterized protein n=1 Tax=Pleurotus eryngii TaxID=5323 RepID=A0A9P5ZVG0_PLEER|nr:hypothetical protein BDN71DRAFT_1393210 [Pleurotus eryngii]
MKGLWLIIRVACVLLQAVEIRSARNITIDDTSPLVHYGGKWGRSNANIFSHEGSHATNRDMNGSASFAFTGVGVYFLSPLFSIPIAVTLTLDGRPPEVVDLQTTVTLNIYESEASSARWGATDLDNVTHSLVVTYGKPLNNTPGPAPYTVVDGFM